MINRRKFILSSTLLGGALNTNFSRAEKVDLVNTKIGNTDLVVPNIGLGSSSTDNPSVIRHAFDRGVRYFDTAESYMGGRAEKAIGNALKDVRDKVVIATKTKARTSSKMSDFKSSLDDSLKNNIWLLCLILIHPFQLY